MPQRRFTHRFGPAAVVLGIGAIATGVPVGWGESFDPTHQRMHVIHAVIGLVAGGYLLAFLGGHVRETTERLRWASAYCFGILAYMIIREVFLRVMLPWFPVLDYLLPLVGVWFVVDRGLRRRIVGLSIALPVVAFFVAAWWTGEPEATIFVIPYHMTLLCFLALFFLRQGLVPTEAGRPRRAYLSGFLLAWCAFAATISGFYLGIGAGQMRAGDAFLAAHAGASWFFALALTRHLFIALGGQRRLSATTPHPLGRPGWWIASIGTAGAMALGALALAQIMVLPERDATIRPWLPDEMALPARLEIDPAGSAVAETLGAEHIGAPEDCRPCHPATYAQWEASAHRHSANPLVQRLSGAAREALGPEGERYCLGCHAPMSVLAGELDGEGRPSPELLDGGVTCVACHSAMGPTHPLGNASQRMARDPLRLFFQDPEAEPGTPPAPPSPPYGSAYGDEGEELEPGPPDVFGLLMADYHELRWSKPYLQDPVMCGGCHLEELDPRLGPHQGVLFDVYRSWEESVYGPPSAGMDPVVGCAECHMPLTDLSLYEEPLHDHRFFGGTSHHARARGDEETARLIDSWLQGDREVFRTLARERNRAFWSGNPVLGMSNSAEGFERAVDSLYDEKFTGREFPDATRWPTGPLLGVTLALAEETAPGEAGEEGADEPGRVLSIAIENRAIGHDFPTAPGDIAETWIHVELVDAQGRTLWASGDEGLHGPLGADTLRLGRFPLDARGEPLADHRIWETASHIDHGMVPPRGTLTKQLSIPGMAQAQSVRARVLYRVPGAAFLAQIGETGPLPEAAVMGSATLPLS